jgi:hypothetical protein
MNEALSEARKATSPDTSFRLGNISLNCGNFDIGRSKGLRSLLKVLQAARADGNMRALFG